jgi:hypothetical protein
VEALEDHFGALEGPNLLQHCPYVTFVPRNVFGIFGKMSDFGGFFLNERF